MSSVYAYIFFLALAAVGGYGQFVLIFEKKPQLVDRLRSSMGRALMACSFLGLSALMTFGIVKGHKEICFFFIVPIVAALAGLRVGFAKYEIEV